MKWIWLTDFRLSKDRRKRAVPDGWVTSDTIQTFKVVEQSGPLYSGARSIPLDTSGDLALVGGANGTAGVYSISQKKVLHELEVGSDAITDAIWIDGRAVFATSSGHVRITQDGNSVLTFKAHSGVVTALALHPCKEILASVGSDKSYVFYDLNSLTQAYQVYTDSSKDFTIQQRRWQLTLT